MVRQPGLFHVDERLSDIGDQLEAFPMVVDFEMIRPDLAAALNYSNGTKDGRPPFDPVLMFKILVIQAQNNVSDCPSSSDLRLMAQLRIGGSGPSRVTSGASGEVLQAPAGEGLSLDPVPIGQDGLPSTEVDVGGREVAWAFMGTGVVVVLDEGADLLFEITGQVVVLEQDPVLERLVPVLDLARRSRVPRGAGARPGCGSCHDPRATPRDRPRCSLSRCR
jgi:hypothetical protein